MRTRNVGYKEGEDFYLTFVYECKEDGEFDECWYYVNGDLFCNTPFDRNGFLSGLGVWNEDDCPFFLGVTPWFSNGNLYFLKGLVYATRLYTIPMVSSQVKANYDMTLKYRSSF